MDTEINPTGETLVGDAQLTSADGGTAVDSSTLTLAELNQLLGKDFKDKDSALKSIKDTVSYVGKKKEDIAAELQQTVAAPQPNLESEVKSLKNTLFYTENPQYKGVRDLITSMGGDPAEVVQSPAFKAVFEKVQVADDVEQKKSVVSSSPRLAQTKTVIDDAVQTANAHATSTEDVALVLARALIGQEEG